jgi:hypothetical protein
VKASTIVLWVPIEEQLLRHLQQIMHPLFSSYNATIDIDVDDNASGGSLMSAGTYFVNSGSKGFGVDEVTRTKILSNGATDLDGSFADGVMSVNFGFSWEFDYNATPGAGVFDWYSTTYHEFTHLVGFASGIVTNSSGNQARDLFNSPPGGEGSWSAFDEFLSDSAGNSVFNLPNANLAETTYQSLLDGGSSPSAGLFFNGTNSGLVGLYSPTTYQPGSSGSHLDTDNTNNDYDGFIMEHSTGPGISTRTFSTTELNMFKDLGYTGIQQIGVIPEPKHLILLLGGVALLGVVISRQYRKAWFI